LNAPAQSNNIMNLFASFLFASIGISSCSALDFTVIDAVDIDTSGNLPPLAERDEEAPRIVGGTPAADGLADRPSPTMIPESLSAVLRVGHR
jgi:hypothetical protein